MIWAYNIMKISVYFLQIISYKITVLEDKKMSVFDIYFPSRQKVCHVRIDKIYKATISRN